MCNVLVAANHLAFIVVFFICFPSNLFILLFLGKSALVGPAYRKTHAILQREFAREVRQSSSKLCELVCLSVVLKSDYL